MNRRGRALLTVVGSIWLLSPAGCARRDTPDAIVITDPRGTTFSMVRYLPSHKRAENVVVIFHRKSSSGDRLIRTRMLVGSILEWNEMTGRPGGGVWVLKKGQNGMPVRETKYDEDGNFKREGTKTSFKEHVRVVVDTELTPEDFARKSAESL